jgi:hypothetical protein
MRAGVSSDAKKRIHASLAWAEGANGRGMAAESIAASESAALVLSDEVAEAALLSV